MHKNLIKTTLLAAAAASAVMLSGCLSGNTPTLNSQKGKTHVKILVDGSDFMYFKGDKVWVQHMAYSYPGKWAGQDLPVFINTGKNRADGKDPQEWKMKWNGNISQQEIILDSPPIPDSGIWDEDNFTVEFSIIGFGEARIIDYTREKNDYTLKIEFNDIEPDGAHWYAADIDWTESK
jgi:hypothetical protein